MRLWSFQSNRATKKVLRGQVYYAEWTYVYEKWRPAFAWMAREMERRGLPMGGNAPIWAWHSCGKHGAPPTLLTARALLSDREMEQGIEVLELEVPPNACLLSSYKRWNEFLDSFIDKRKLPNRASYLDMFDISAVQKGDDVQAALPRIERQWVVKTWPLKLGPDHCNDDPAKRA